MRCRRAGTARHATFFAEIGRTWGDVPDYGGLFAHFGGQLYHNKTRIYQEKTQLVHDKSSIIRVRYRINVRDTPHQKVIV